MGADRGHSDSRASWHIAAPARSVRCRQTLHSSVARITLLTSELLLLIALAGCSWPSQNGDGRTHLVLGIGFITVSDDQDSHEVGDGLDAMVQRIEMTGAFASFVPDMSGLLIGHIRRQSVEVDPAAEIIIDVNTTSDGIMHFQMWRPQLSAVSDEQESNPSTKE